MTHFEICLSMYDLNGYLTNMYHITDVFKIDSHKWEPEYIDHVLQANEKQATKYKLSFEVEESGLFWDYCKLQSRGIQMFTVKNLSLTGLLF